MKNLNRFSFAIAWSFVLLATSEMSHAAAVVTGAGGAGGVTNDIFDISRGAFVISSSPLLGGAASFAENTFGGMGGVEAPHTLFADGPAAGFVDFINFRTPTPTALTGYTAILADDSDDPANPGNPKRGSSSFRLFSSPDSSFTTLTLISTTTLPLSYQATFGSNAVAITDTFSPVIAEFFRIEVVRSTDAPNNGPRIREVDGVGTAVPEPGCVILISCGAFGLFARSRLAANRT